MFLKKCFFSSNSIKNPQVLNRERERKRKKKYFIREREKLQESLQIKGEFNILRGGKHFNFKNPLYMIPFSPPPSYRLKNLF
jgi:hypothetical protein